MATQATDSAPTATEDPLGDRVGQLLLAQEAAGIGTWDWNLEGGTIRWSPEMYRTLGVDAGRPDLFEAWQEVVHPLDLEEAVASAKMYAGRPGDFSIEFRVLRRDGEVRWILSKGSCIGNKTGKPVRMIGVNIDLTERKSSEIALRNSQQRLDEVLRVTQVGLWEADLVQKRLTASPTCKANFGLPPEADFTYGSFNAAIHPEDRSALDAAKARAVAGEPYQVEYRNVWPDGSTHWIYSRANLERDPAGTPIRLMGLSLDITERRRAEEALREGEQRLRATYDQAPVGIVETDGDGRFLRVNDKLCEITGYSREELLQTDLAAVTLAADRDEDMARYRQQWRGELGSTTIEKRYVQKSGRTAWVGVSSSIVRDGAGRPLYGIRAVRDITSRKLAEERLAEQTKSLEILNRVGTLLTAELDLDRLVQAVTDAGTELTGARMGAFLYTVRDSAGESFMLFTLSGVPRSAFEAFGMPRKTEVFGPTFRGDGVVRADDITLDPRYGKNAPHRGMPAGHPPVRSYLAVPVASRSGEVIGGLIFGHEKAGVFSARAEQLAQAVAAQAAVAVDNARLFQQAQDEVAGRKRSQAELLELNATLEARVAERTRERDRTWQLSQDLLLVADFDARIEAVSPAWAATLGWTEGDLQGALFLEFVHPDDLARTQSETRCLEQGHSTSRFENRYRHRDGSYRWISWTAVPDAGRIYATGRDVTSEKEREAALALAGEQLRQSQKMEAIGQLTGGIAHDFNNLLAGITGSFELVTKRVSAGRTEGLERFTSAAMTSAQRAAALTQRLLAFARRQPLDPRRVDVRRLVAGMEDLLRRTLGPGVSLELVSPDLVWPILCDPNQLENAILNVAINGRDAMPEGGRLTIAIAEVCLDQAAARGQGGSARPGEYVMVSVTDTGMGMPPDIVAKAFDPFFTTKPLGQGTGLGLSMLYGFIQQSDGYVRVRSAVGQGTTMELCLPRFFGAGTDDDQVQSAEETRALTKETVLVVDDEATVRMLVTETLDELGYASLVAEDGPSGLRILESDTRIDLLVTDVGLPGLDGRQLAEAARLARPGLKVLFITGYAHHAALGVGTALEPGMELITKPFPLAQLAERMQAMLVSS